jgi:hypothetical protein
MQMPARIISAVSLILLIPLLILCQPASAQGRVIVQHSDPKWQATYWNNTSLSGTPALERQETDLNYDWGGGSPHTGVSADRFSARWTRYIDVTPGTYRLTATSDDGVRVWVDDQLLIDQWHDHPATTYSAEKVLGTGHHLVKVEYYENSGAAVAKISWTQVVDTVQHWRGEYYNNRTLSGSPSLVRDDAQISFSWGGGSPAPGHVEADVFSVRWTRNLDLPAGTYRFTMTVDDGGRLYVNGRTLIDAWKDQPATTYTGDIHLSGGPVSVQMEYYESYGDATAKLTWSPVDGSPIQHWQGEYYNNMYLSGSPALVRDDPSISFGWGTGSPASGVINADEFSARWSRSLDLPAGNYRFTMTVDDGGRLYVNGHLLIDAWKDQPPSTYTGDVYLSGGSVSVQMEYYENRGGATAQLSWGSPGPAPAPAGAVVVDDTSSAFSRNGSSTGWRTVSEGYGGRLTWTYNNDYTRSNYNWARWYPDLGARRYEVFVYIPERYTTTSQARYWVSHADGYTLRVVDQSANGDRWVSLGAYRFAGTSADYVSLSDVTYEPYLSRLIAFDAVKWEPR